MLVVSRKEAERILCQLPDGSYLAIEVKAIHKRRVAISIDAPGSVLVLREELVTGVKPTARALAARVARPPFDSSPITRRRRP